VAKGRGELHKKHEERGENKKEDHSPRQIFLEGDRMGEEQQDQKPGTNDDPKRVSKPEEGKEAQRNQVTASLSTRGNSERPFQ